MEELVGVVCVLMFVVGVLACCAVGAWVIGAAAIKGLFGDTKKAQLQRCPQCGRQSLVNGRCLNCGGVPNVSVAERARDDLQATARQLHRLHAAGHLPYDQCVSLLKVLETDLARLGYPLPLEVWPNAKVTGPGTSPFAPPVAPQEAKLADELKLGDVQQVAPAPISVVEPRQPQVLDALVIDETTAPAESPFPSPFALAPAARQEPRPPIIPPQPITPSRTLADMLQGFMEESNIRWGEIIGGLLIVICAIGLVISLGATVKIPYFPALLFLIFTFFFHLAGLYTHWYWKLAAVSRAILVIALLLVPLGFSAGVVLERADAQPSLPLLLTAVSIGLAVFGWIAWSGAKVLTGEGALRLTTAILGCCLGQVVINRGAFPGISQQSLTLLALLPVASFLVAAIGQIWRAQAWQRMSSRRIEQTFLILGVALFAILPPFALLIFKLPPRWHTFKELAPLLCLVATCVLTLGIVVHRRALAKTLATLRTAGTAIALTGGALLILLWVVAWPRPDLLLNVSVLTGGLLLAVAIRTRMPALHVAATSALSVGVLVAFVWISSLVSATLPTGVQWLQALLLGRTSLLFTGLAAALGAGGVWFLWRRDRQIGTAYLGTAGVLGVLSLAIAAWSGFTPLVPIGKPWTGDGDLAGPLFFVYAIALFVIAIKITNENILATAMALLWVALIQLLAANGTTHEMLKSLHLVPERPVLVATIIEGVILAVMALVVSRPSWRLHGEAYTVWQQTPVSKDLVVPLTYGAAFAIATATPFILWVLPGRFTVHAIYAGLAAGVWVIACVARRWPAALAATQAMAAVAVAFAIATIWSPDQTDWLWFARGAHLQAQLLALAGSAAVWSIVRRSAQPQSVLHDLLRPSFPACDHVLLGSAVALLSLLSISAALPGVAWELGLGETKLTQLDIAWLDPANVSRLTVGLAGVVIALVIALLDRVTGWKLIGLSLAGWAGCFLLAQTCDTENAVASAARWSIVLYGLVLMAAFLSRHILQRGLQTQAWLRWQEIDEPTREWFRYQPLLLGVLPMLILTIIAVAQFATGANLHLPIEGSLFQWMQPTASYAGPLLVGVAIFLGLALGQRQPAFAFGGGLLFLLAANLAFILHVTGKTPGPPGTRAAELLQWNTIAAAIYALIWFSLSLWLIPRDPKLGALRLNREKFFLGHISLSCLFILIAALWAAGGIIRFPDGLSAESTYLGHWSNVVALGLLAAPLLAATGVTRSKRTWPLAGSVLLALLTTALPLLALRWEYYRGVGTWAAYHVLEVGWLGLAAIVAGAYAWQAWSAPREFDSQKISRRGFTPQHLLGAGLCAVVVFLAVRGNYRDPAEPYLSAISTAGVCAVLIVLGLARRSQPYAIASLIIAPLAVALPWFTPSMNWLLGLGNSTFLVALCSCLLVTIAVGGLWQFVEIRMQRKWQQTFSPRWFGPLAGHLAIGGVTAVLALAGLLHLVFVGNAWYVNGLPEIDAGLIALAGVWLALGFVNVGSLWDRRATFVFPALLIWSWIACALALAPLRASPLPMFCLHALATAGVFALAGHLWSYGANLAAWGERLGVSDTIGGLTRIDRWLPWLTLVLGLSLCAFELIGMWNLSTREHRVAIAFAPALVGYALACLAQQKRQDAFQLAALLLGGLTCVYLGWSNLDPGWELAHWMTRAFQLLMVLAVVTLGYGFVLPRFVFHAESWLRASQRAGYVSSVLAITALVCLLSLEVALFKPGLGVAEVDPLQVGAVAVLLVLFIAGLISLALAPGAHEPREQQRRTWYVYGAQVVAGLLFAHLYLCQPGWFDGVLKPYWPFIVLAIAFSGVGLGELFWRLRLPVLAEPFQRTGAFLPVLPILGLLLTKSDYNYTLLLFCAGLMYLILSITRKSWAAAIAATIAGNGALWALLTEENWRIDQNPQFWLIPPAISVLVAAHINRNRLKEEYLSGIRYASLVVIYVSSTFEIFLHRAEVSLWPPIILALLSLFGALAGVLLRVRAFLYLGAVFTLLALVSMVWHAARAIDQVWPWWAFGFVMGVAILGLLAFLEKNRPQVQALVARLRQWDQ